MKSMTVLTTGGSPSDIGRAHGNAFGEQIRSYMATRRKLSLFGTDLTENQVTEIAADMLDAHRDYDSDLFDEMVAMAGAAGITPAEAVIVGGYTDFIDAVRALASGRAVEDTCTAVITPDGSSQGSGFLAQTWDMNASATPHVFMLDVTPEGSPRALAFTTHGTVGQIGMNEAGIAIGINNLTVTDGGIGVTWPFVVRKALKQTTYADALACITDANLAGGHNFLLFDGAGNGASIEATTTKTVVDELGDAPLVHTNHCLFSDTQMVEAERPAALNANSIQRLSDATVTLNTDAPYTTESMMALLSDENSICRRPEPPFEYESSGAVVMRPGTGDLWACWGQPSDNEFEHFKLS
jgi:isopenicillin-N N-acyltransferase like protein